jgi:hypothetical protein
MKKALFLLMLFTLTSFLFQISCEDRSVSPRKTHWDAVKAIISEYPDVFAFGFFDTETDTPFYRKITQSNADIEVETLYVADSLHLFDCITLTWGDSLKGKSHYYFNEKLYQKPIYFIALTRAYFEKWGFDSDDYRGWLLKQFGGTVIKSVGTTRWLNTLNIVSDGLNVTLNESKLLNLVRWDSTLVFGKGEQVTFTIDVSDTSDFFFLHVNEEVPQKIPFASIGGGKFSAWWITTTDPGKRYYHAIVDVVSQKLVTDTPEEYDSKAWGIIYQIK